VLGFVYPSLPVEQVLAAVQSFHDSREDSWCYWDSPETEEQREFTRKMIQRIRLGRDVTDRQFD
jgi:hypothetical protein